MRALVIHRYGGPDVLHLETLREPIPGPRDLLITVHAASLNPIDFKIRQGKLHQVERYRFPLLLGCDVAGVVTQVGADVTGFAVGDEVFARLEKHRMGGLAEMVVADASVVARKPAALSFIEAAALPLAGLTALQALEEAAELRPGQRALTHAGAGGVGRLAIQIARLLELEVATTTSTRNIDLVRSLGATTIVDYTKQDFTKELKDLDAVFDTLGETELQDLAVVKPGGVVVGIGGLPDEEFARARKVSLPVRLALRVLTARRRRAYAKAGVRFRYLFMRPDGAQLGRLGAWAQQGALKPVIHAIFPFAEVKAAFEELERGRARGKIVVQIQ